MRRKNDAVPAVLKQSEAAIYHWLCLAAACCESEAEDEKERKGGVGWVRKQD